MALVSGLRQVAQRAPDLDAAERFYGGVLGLRRIGRFDPPGLLFFDLGEGTRLLLEGAASSATLYFAVPDIDAVAATLAGHGFEVETAPHLVHRDDDGLFGPPGQEEWLAFARDPAGNPVGFFERR